MSVEIGKRIGKLSYSFEVNGHVVTVDEPENLGGENSAPSPHDYLLVSLAACTSITMQMYANRKGIPLQSSNIQIEIVKESDSNEILRKIRLVGELTQEHREDLFRIAKKCPIHKFLEKGATIYSELESPESGDSERAKLHQRRIAAWENEGGQLASIARSPLP